jgi:hypothetical protein
MKALDDRIDALPLKVHETRRFAFGQYRGLAFGLVLYPGDGADVYLEGALNRHAQLSRDHHGPRAVVNALDRLVASYGTQIDTARQELAIAENQLRDHQARIGRPFTHAAYQDELATLRDRLKAGLSQATPEPGAPTVTELAESIKALKAAHTIDAAPTRTTSRRLAAEVPVTARIRRRSEPAPVIEPPAEIAPAEAYPSDPAVEPIPQAEIRPFPPVTPAAAIQPQPDYRHQVASRRRHDGRQLSLF